MNRGNELVKVTPEDAKRYLSKMGRNRKPIEARVAKYACDMANGTFNSTSSLSFNPKGELIDGQHRLLAVIRTGIPQYFYIDTDVPDDTIFDRGKERTIAQSAYMSGLIDEKVSGERCTSLVRAYVASKYGKNVLSRVTDTQYAEFLTQFEDSVTEAIRMSKSGGMARLCKKAPIQAAIFAAFLDGESPDRLEDFCKCVNSGFYEGNENTAAIVFRNMIMSRVFVQLGSGYGECLTSVAEKAIWDFCRKKSRQQSYPIPTLAECKHCYVSKCKADIDWGFSAPAGTKQGAV